MALGLRAAFLRALRALWASCSRVVPNSWKWRWAHMAIQLAAEGAPNGSVHSRKPLARNTSPRPPKVTLDRPFSPWAEPSVTVRKQRTWLAYPAETAAQALITEPSWPEITAARSPIPGLISA